MISQLQGYDMFFTDSNAIPTIDDELAVAPPGDQKSKAKQNKNFRKKIPKDAETANILVSCWCRLKLGNVLVMGSNRVPIAKKLNKQ